MLQTCTADRWHAESQVATFFGITQASRIAVSPLAERGRSLDSHKSLCVLRQVAGKQILRDVDVSAFKRDERARGYVSQRLDRYGGSSLAIVVPEPVRALDQL